MVFHELKVSKSYLNIVWIFISSSVQVDFFNQVQLTFWLDITRYCQAYLDRRSFYRECVYSKKNIGPTHALQDWQTLSCKVYVYLLHSKVDFPFVVCLFNNCPYTIDVSNSYWLKSFNDLLEEELFCFPY